MTLLLSLEDTLRFGREEATAATMLVVFAGEAAVDAWAIGVSDAARRDDGFSLWVVVR